MNLSRRSFIWDAAKKLLVPYVAAEIEAPGQLLLHRRKAFREESAGITYLLSEDFEGTGTPSGWSSSGSVDFDYATSPAPLVGAQSLSVGNSTGTATTSNFPAQTHPYGFYRYYHTAASSANFYCRTGAGGTTLRWSTTSGGGTTLYCGTVSSYLGLVITPGALNFIWWEYQAGTGSDGIGRIWISSTTTKPGSPTGSITNGDATATVVSLRWLNLDVDAADIMIIDSVRVADVEIGSNPT